MRKLILSVAIAFGAITTNYAQEAYPCHTDEKTQSFLETLSPQERIEYQQEQNLKDQNYQNFIANNPQVLTSSNNNQRTISYTIPVVFHIIHEGGPENITEAQIMNALQHMNDDYQKLNSSWSNVVSDFLPIVADAEIEFKLAKLDNNGNCTNGITRTLSSYTNGGTGEDRVSTVKAQHGNWPGNKYINIFVAKDIGGAAGYTYRPSNYIGAGMGNGIHVLHNYVGSIGTSGSNGAHTLSHEVGHWLDLPHTWGGTNNPGLPSNCNDDDGISDTPNTIGWTTCTLDGESCGSLDNVENFMEYSYCTKMFTNGQKGRMHNALGSSIGGRNNVHSQSNLTATGVNLPDVLCKAEFKADRITICSGGSVEFEDLSFSNVSDWSWSFPGGSPSSSTSQNPTVTYNTPGKHEVTLTVSDGATSKSITKGDYIRVLDLSASLPVSESFEYLNALPESFWTVENKGNNAGFSITSSTAFTGSKSVKLKNFGQPAGSFDALLSNPIDLSPITDDVTLSFRYAYRKRSQSNNEWLRVYITNDCGENWVQRKTLTGSALGTEIESSSWTPSSNDDWVTVHMTNITSDFWEDNFRFKFEFESDGGNNLYIDDINIYQGTPADEPSLNVNDESLIQSFGVYPNPADDLANVTFSLENNQNVKVSLVNMMGKTIQSNDIKAQTGDNLVMLNTKNVQAGIYLVKVYTKGVQQVKRLVVK